MRSILPRRSPWAKAGRVAIVVLLAVCATPAVAAEPPALVKARTLYNGADYEGAIQAAADVRRLAEWEDEALLVIARSHLELYRQRSDSSNLVMALEALTAVRAAGLTPRDYVDLLVGQGQHLYFSEQFGVSAEMFDRALAQSFLLNVRERLMLLDWWANAQDRSAQARPVERRAAVFERLVERMDEELRRDPANPIANYWLAVGARGVGDVERAWDAAMAGWVLSRLSTGGAEMARRDLDRFVVQVLIPERVRGRGSREQQEASKAMRDEWERFKEQWK
jgi:hypothetical protein